MTRSLEISKIDTNNTLHVQKKIFHARTKMISFLDINAQIALAFIGIDVIKMCEA